jgi:hypothetical protein
MRLTVALWTGTGSMPSALLRYRIMEKFGWTPAQLNAISWREFNEILTCMSVENQVNHRRKSTQKTGKRR